MLHYFLALIQESTKYLLCYKLPIFKTFRCMFRVLKQLITLDFSLPCLRAFQSGTIWSYTKRDIKYTKGQSWKFYFRYKRIETFLLWPVIFLIPLYVQGHRLPHLKALRYVKDETRVLSCGSTLNIH